MDAEDIKKFILESFKSREVVKAFCDHILDDILTPALKFRDDEIQALRREMKAKDDEINDLKQKIDEQEQYSRKYCLVVKGVAEKVNENTSETVTDMAAAAGVQLSTTDIDVVHRLRSRAQPEAADVKPRDIIIKFTNMTARKQLWAARRDFSKVHSNRPEQQNTRMTRSASTSAHPQTASAVYITESLTKHRANIMYQARQMKKERKLAAAWTDEGVMKVRRREGDRTVVVHTMQDIYDLLKH